MAEHVGTAADSGRGGWLAGFAARLLLLVAAAGAGFSLWRGTTAYHDRVTFPPLGGHRPAPKDANIVGIELGGHKFAPALVTNVSNTRAAVHADSYFIIGYGIALLIGTLLAWYLMRSRYDRSWLSFGLAAALVTIAADITENWLLLRAISGDKTFRADSYDLASIAAVVKFCSLLPAAVVAAGGVGLAVIRALSFHNKEVLSRGDFWPALPITADDGSNAGPADPATPQLDPVGSLARWQRGFHIPKPTGSMPLPVDDQVTGVCLSGGGVRAASVALGVLQAEPMRDQVLPNTQYLVSVSGGGYTAGAFVQALTGAGVPDPSQMPDPATAFAPGSPEQDHIRRHSSYLADTPAKLIAALGLVAGHLLLTLTLLYGTAIALGIAVGILFRRIPVTDLTSLASNLASGVPHPPSIRNGSLIALAAGAGLAVLFALAVHLDAAHSDRAGHHRGVISAIATFLRRLTILIAIVTIVLPELIWVSAWLLHHSASSVHVASPIAAVLLTYLAGLKSLFSGKKSLFNKKSSGTGSAVSAAPGGVLQMVLVILTMLILVVGWLLVAGGMATVGLNAHLSTSTRATVLGLLIVLGFLGGLTDETTLSLHPFYRRRLASTFAVRRVRRADGQILAKPYPSTERTTLSKYGELAEPRKFPQVIFAASATLGQNRTPPGANRVSYTFSSEWVGGPDVGYVRTEMLEKLSPSRLKRDLTVQGAVALSGAAIAASLGGQGSSWYQSLFVVTGARLGAWMPNPAFVIERYCEQRSITRPGLPHTRRLDYLLRELFGSHPPEGPLLQVTDGGFYDNLGLVELFRRGCTRIYCIDASGDSPPAASTLAQALTIAYAELGVQTCLADDTWSTATAGSGTAMSPKDPLAALSARLSKTGILTGHFSYPDCGPSRCRTGTIVVAKASLWPELPYQLLSFAQGANTFPHVSTANQWFDGGEYAAYTALGRELGRHVVKSMAAAEKLKRPCPPEDAPVAGATATSTKMSLLLRLSKCWAELTVRRRTR